MLLSYEFRSHSVLGLNMLVRLVFPILLSFLLISCGRNRESAQERSEKERDERVERLQAESLSNHPKALAFAPDNRDPFGHKLTIEVQNAIATNSSQLYWMMQQRFDLHRTRNQVRVVFRGPSDNWLSLECSEEQASELLHSCKPNYVYPLFLFYFSLTDVSPLRIELRGERNDSEEDAPLSVSAGNIDGRFYSGKLVDFALIDEGEAPANQ